MLTCESRASFLAFNLCFSQTLLAQLIFARKDFASFTAVQLARRFLALLGKTSRSSSADSDRSSTSGTILLPFLWMRLHRWCSLCSHHLNRGSLAYIFNFCTSPAFPFDSLQIFEPIRKFLFFFHY